MLLLAPYGGMLSVRGHLLLENILDVVGPIGAVLAGALQGCEEGVGAVVIFEREQLFDTLVQRLPSGGEVFEIGLGHIAQGNKGADLLREPVTRVMALGCLSGLGQFQTLFAPPATPMGGDGAVLEVEGNVVMIGLDGEGFGNLSRGAPNRCCHRMGPRNRYGPWRSRCPGNRAQTWAEDASTRVESAR